MDVPNGVNRIEPAAQYREARALPLPNVMTAKARIAALLEPT
jgi:hypothetical protein